GEEWSATPGSSAAREAFNAALAAQHPEDKVRHYARALKHSPDFFEAWFNLALAEESLGHLDSAATAYEKARALRPAAVPPARNLAGLRMKQGNAAAALLLYKQAAALQPESAALRNDTGVALMAMKQYTDALAEFRRAIELDPAHEAALYNRGM